MYAANSSASLILLLLLDLCLDLGVESYPSLYFIGYGNFYQSGSFSPNIVKFQADIYPDAILVWLRMLNTVSSYQQKWDIFKSLLPFSSHKTLLMRQHSALLGQAGGLQHQVQAWQRVQEREQVRGEWESDAGVDRGDVFSLLSSMDAHSEVVEQWGTVMDDVH